jgi:5-methylcytosine-specific restriction endonuclease McrA
VIPAADQQLGFLTKLQRLFAEGDFTATYKFALLMAMAELAVERGKDDDCELLLTHRDLASKFIEFYWQQSVPYSAGGGIAEVLVQNLGQQAAVVKAIVLFRKKHPNATVLSAPGMLDYSNLLTKVADTVKRQPVTYLQNLGGSTDPFLYEPKAHAIVLRSGVAYCFRRFQPLVQSLTRGRWIAHIKSNQRNHAVLGQADDLEAFLFETPSKTLAVIAVELRRLTGSRCFYCGKSVTDADVDHFIPRALYPRDLAHNFVLSHPACNRSKSDTLAARGHLERWIGYVERHSDDLSEIGAKAGRVSDVAAVRSVARWGYANAANAGAQAWLRSKTYETVDVGYLTCLA